MTIDDIDEAIKHCEEVAEENQRIVDTGILFDDVTVDMLYCDDTEVIEEHLESYKICAEKYRQLAEWLKELKTYREFVDLLVKWVLKDDWKESGDFYAEVICRKLTKLGKLKVVDNKYMEVNADADSN